MIDLTKYEKILEEGLILDHYFLLVSIRDGCEIPANKRMKGFINLLTKKGYILEGILTESAMDLIETEGDISTSTTTTVAPTDFMTWVIGLHQKCQAKMVENIGAKQIRTRINGRGTAYPFMPNATDFGKTLARVINSYKLKDIEALEKCILNYVGRQRKKDDEWFPLLKYYIMKEGQSQMVTDLESMDSEEVKVVKSTQKHV